MTAQFRVGDRVKATLGKTIVEGEVCAVSVARHLICVRPERAGITAWMWVPTDGRDGWTVEVLPEPEPPTKAVVLDRWGTAWQRLGDGWYSADSTAMEFDTLDDLDAQRGPLTLLEVAA